MASIETQYPAVEKAAHDRAVAPTSPSKHLILADVVLRFLLFASGVVAVVVMVTSNQTEIVRLPFPPFPLAHVPAKFRYSPAFVYFVAALSVAGLYGIITTLVSLYALFKPSCSKKVLCHFVVFDVLLLGIVAAATGAAGAVGYVGLRGNSHVGWKEVCHEYNKYCKHIAGSLVVSLFGSIVLVLLVLLSVYSLSKRIPKY
ncbi:hypothetical protein RD792_010463 [Penstemon davidsonii]|uniref:CASP-like protein n=1 Tax=Penstemon davidsonii TaxID=160366 RepID=A0ABR0D3U4_9LAMI|nr:hypothetical protein RD792_010463 [Penstemon davidsonii]